ncbi:MAG: 3-hydroxyacyl-CoA dehydrogenase NAD-binding domain-containing protein, partial [Chloroflexota bacterium]|nr:3-hydroxyacyl-CoA dehydrogenase NAD-binding domain-containing protein [Chloroflexota bacterium]
MVESWNPKVGVVGAGTMGAGIAQVAAQAGLPVVLIDQADEWVERGMGAIADGLERLVAKTTLSVEERDAVLARIKVGTGYDLLTGCEFVVEAVNERFDIKTEVFQRIAEVDGEEAVIASNTSSISITALAAKVPRPERVAGMHFFNPVPVLPLVEVVRGVQTSEETLARVRSLAERMGKTPVDVADAPGFVANRVLMPMINEAIFCLSEGVAAAEAIDQVMKLGMAHPMGPLALADLIGLDVCLDILATLQRDLGEDKYRPAPLLRRLVAAGRLG